MTGTNQENKDDGKQAGSIGQTVIYSIKELKEMLSTTRGKEPPHFMVSTGKAAFEEMGDLIDGEVFRQDPETKAEGSNFGRVRYDGKILPQTSEEGHATKDYLQVKIPKSGTVYVWRVIAGAWCEKRPGANIVHHITNNGYDNRPANLLWVNDAEHKAIH